MHKGRLVLAILGGLGIISTFLPWITNTPDFSKYGLNFSASVTESGMDNNIIASINIICFIGIIAFSILGKRTQMVSKGIPKMGILMLSGLLLLGSLIFLLACGVSSELEAEIGLLIIPFLSITCVFIPYVFKSNGSVEIPTVKSVIDDIEESAEIVEDKAEIMKNRGIILVIV